MGNLDRSLRHGPFDALSDRLGPSDANLFGRKADELGEKCAFILDRGRKKLSDGELERGETDLALFRDNGGEVTFSARIEQLFFETEARRDDPDDLARHDPTDGARIGHLLAERDLMPKLRELLDVARDRMMRNACHGDRLIVWPLAATRQGDLEKGRCDHRIVEEELVEIAQPKENERVGISIFRPEKLLHNGRISVAIFLHRSVDAVSDLHAVEADLKQGVVGGIDGVEPLIGRAEREIADVAARWELKRRDDAADVDDQFSVDF